MAVCLSRHLIDLDIERKFLFFLRCKHPRCRLENEGKLKETGNAVKRDSE